MIALLSRGEFTLNITRRALSLGGLGKRGQEVTGAGHTWAEYKVGHAFGALYPGAHIWEADLSLK
jgi:hypothetical protein